MRDAATVARCLSSHTSPVPGALITDFHLARADGLAVARYARSRRALMPIFLVAGYPPPLASGSDSLEGPVVVMTKPLDYADLLRRLTGALPPVGAA